MLRKSWIIGIAAAACLLAVPQAASGQIVVGGYGVDGYGVGPAPVVTTVAYRPWGGYVRPYYGGGYYAAPYRAYARPYAAYRPSYGPYYRGYGTYGYRDFGYGYRSRAYGWGSPYYNAYRGYGGYGGGYYVRPRLGWY